MVRNVLFCVLVALLVIGIYGISFAMCGMCGGGETHPTTNASVQGESADVGNKICPVLGEKIDSNTKITQEYNGKKYNLCCPKCVSEFQKDPKKYTEIADKEVSTETAQIK